MSEPARRFGSGDFDPPESWFRKEKDKLRNGTDMATNQADRLASVQTANGPANGPVNGPVNGSPDSAPDAAMAGLAGEDAGAERRVFVGSAGAGVAEAAGSEPGRHAAPGSAGSGQSGRPFWLPRPCPAWCTSRHEDRDHPAERQHVSAVQGGVVLTQSEAVPAEDGSWQPQDIQIFLAQHVREIEPLIRCNGQGPVGAWQLTVAEADALATALAKAVAATRAP